MSHKRIAFLLEAWTLNGGTGITTFVNHAVKMCRENGFKLDLILEKKVFKDYTDETVTMFYPADTAIVPCTLDAQVTITAPTLEHELEKYLRVYTPSKIVAHTFSSTLALSAVETSVQKLAYTHIGDVLDTESRHTDFSTEIARAYLALYSNIGYPIATQSKSTQGRLRELLPSADVIVLPEPYYCKPDSTRGKEGILIIGSHAPRKKHKAMFKALVGLGLPVTVITQWGGILKQLVEDVGLQDCTIKLGLSTEEVLTEIKRHRVLLHFADLEFMPYSILEASPHLPCLVSDKAEWCKGELPCPITRVDTTDPLQEILNAYTGDYVGFDTAAYIQEFEGKWLNL